MDSKEHYIFQTIHFRDTIYSYLAIVMLDVEHSVA